MNRLFRAELGLPIRGIGLSQHRHSAQQKTAGHAHVLRFAFFVLFLSHRHSGNPVLAPSLGLLTTTLA